MAKAQNKMKRTEIKPENIYYKNYEYNKNI